MASPEEISHQQDLLAAYRRTLAQYLKRQATLGEAFTPPEVSNGITEARTNIQRIKKILRAWCVPVEDSPDDDENIPSVPKQPKAATRVVGQRITDISTFFRDRNSQLTEISRLLAHPATRIVSVIGRGGIGKTAIVSKILGDLESRKWPGQMLSKIEYNSTFPPFLASQSEYNGLHTVLVLGWCSLRRLRHT